MIDTTTTRSKPVSSARRPVLAAIAAAVPSGVACAGIALLAGAAGVPPIPQLGAPAVAVFAMAGATIGAIGWAIIRRRAADPRRVLTWLVPAVLLLSFLPDVALGLATAAASGLGPVLTLASMHLATVVIAVPVYARLLPLPPRAGSADRPDGLTS